MKKIALVLAVSVLMAGAVLTGCAKKSAAGGKVVMGALIRNLNETFLRDYADNLKKLAND